MDRSLASISTPTCDILCIDNFMHSPTKNKPKNGPDVGVVDLFCGIGGMTHGFKRKGFRVLAGIDNDTSCRYGYEANNGAEFIDSDISKFDGKQLRRLFGKSSVKILIGCAPCQPFSRLNPNGPQVEDQQPLRSFARLITEVKPQIISMENVRGLVKYPIFEYFLGVLRDSGYQYDWKVIDCSDYGVPQKRQRLVLLASRLGEIKIIPPTHAKEKVSLREVISDLPPIKDGEASADDPLHRARLLSVLNKKRIKATPANGGNMTSWSDELMLKCHKKKSGRTYRATVYGRMRWNEPAPTMTTHCTGLGNGRFGHPEQDRAISYREAARIQTFPDRYRFFDPEKGFHASDVSRFIGNAVPVRLGEIVAESIKRHLDEVNKK